MSFHHSVVEFIMFGAGDIPGSTLAWPPEPIKNVWVWRHVYVNPVLGRQRQLGGRDRSFLGHAGVLAQLTWWFPGQREALSQKQVDSNWGMTPEGVFWPQQHAHTCSHPPTYACAPAHTHTQTFMCSCAQYLSSFSCWCEKLSRQKQLDGERVHFTLQFRGTVDDGRGVRHQALEAAVPSHIHKQEAGNNKCMPLLSSFSPFMKSRGWCCSQ